MIKIKFWALSVIPAPSICRSLICSFYGPYHNDSWSGRQGNVKVRLNPVKKIPLNPPLIKWDLMFTPLIKGALIFPPFEKGVGGILKLKAFHIRIIILDATLTQPWYGRYYKTLQTSFLSNGPSFSQPGWLFRREHFLQIPVHLCGNRYVHYFDLTGFYLLRDSVQLFNNLGRDCFVEFHEIDGPTGE